MVSKRKQTSQDVEAQPDSISLQNGHEASSLQEAGPNEADISTFMDIAQRLEQELCSIVIGQERVIRELFLALFAGGHVLLEGVPGLGKTLLVRTLADALALKFARIQFTPDLMP